MFELQTANLFANLSVAVAGLVVSWIMLRLLDMATGIEFRDVLSEILEADGNIGPAIYYGARLIAVLWLVGACLSRVPI